MVQSIQSRATVLFFFLAIQPVILQGSTPAQQNSSKTVGTQAWATEEIWTAEARQVLEELEPTRHGEAFSEEGLFPLLAAEWVEHLRSRFGCASETMQTMVSDVGQLYFQKKAFREASLFFDHWLALAQQNPGPGSDYLIAAMSWSAKNESKLGNYYRAVQMQERAVDLATEKKGYEDPIVLSLKHDLAHFLSDASNYSEALGIFREVLRIRESRESSTYLEKLKTKHEIAVLLLRMGKTKESAQIFETILLEVDQVEIEFDIFTSKAKFLASVKLHKAMALSDLGHVAESIAFNRTVLDDLGQSLGLESIETQQARNNLAADYIRSGKHQEALTLLNSSIPILTSILGESHPATLTARRNFAVSLGGTGELSRSIEELKNILETERSSLGSLHPQTLISTNNLASALADSGQLAMARHYLDHVLGQVEGKLGKNHKTALAIRKNAIGVALMQGDLEGADVYLENVDEKELRTLLADDPDRLAFTRLKALLWIKSGDFGQAIELLTESLPNLKTILGVSHPEVKATTINLLEALAKSGQHEKVLEVGIPFFRSLVKDLGSGLPRVLDLRIGLAESLLRLGEVDQASSLMEGASLEQNPLAPLIIGRICAARGEQCAGDFFQEALILAESSLDEIDFSEDIREIFASNQLFVYHEILEWALVNSEQPKLALEVLERSRARNLDRLLRGPKSRGSLPDLLEERFELDRLGWRLDHLSRRLDRLDPNKDSEEFQLILEEQYRARRAKDKLVADFRSRIEGPKPEDRSNLLESLEPGTLYVSYRLREFDSNAFVFGADRPLQVHSLQVTKTVVENQIQRFLELISSPDTDRLAFARLSQWLYRTLIEPFSSLLEDSERLLLILDGGLHLLPFQALVDSHSEEASSFLIESLPIYHSQSLEIHKQLRGSSNRVSSVQRKKWIGFGGPVMQAGDRNEPTFGSWTSGQRQFIHQNLGDLPYASREIREIESQFSEAEAASFLGSRATEEQARIAIENASVIHFATHGVTFFPDQRRGIRPRDSFLALSQTNESGSRHNGFLQAWEIAEQLRTDADLVVLSACETAVGEIRGSEGLVSLSRAFQVAGAKSVLASLWKVDDLATSELMVRFYRHLIGGKTLDEALQLAQKEFISGPIYLRNDKGDLLKRDLSHPYYWAAFQLSGNRDYSGVATKEVASEQD